MRVVLKGKINSLYVQSLCMMFFRGEKFPEKEENPKGEIVVETVDFDDGIHCMVTLSYCGRSVNTNAFEKFNDFEKYERISKTVVGRAVFEAGTKLTGYLPPWGHLTGIRPSLVAQELINTYGKEKAVNILIDKYLLSAKKAELAVLVAENENLVLKEYSANTCSVYISIPFCPTRCVYCSFVSYATKKLFQLIPEYIDRIVDEVKNTFNLIDKLKMTPVCVYIGGGTPTTLTDFQLERILSTVKECLNGRELAEFTLEGGRPDTITESKLEILKKYGVTRISVNPQTLNDDVLKNIGRNHTVEDFYSAFNNAKKVEFDVINTDLIAGLETDTYDSFKVTVDKIVELNPENVTVHSFSVKKSAQILHDNHEIYHNDGKSAIKSVNYAYEKLTESGYIPYYMYRQKNTVSDLENVGYAKKGTFGIYNVLMMGDGHTVFGIGAGSTTKLIKKSNGKNEILRIFSPKYPYEYLQDNQNFNEKIVDFLKGGSNDEND